MANCRRNSGLRDPSGFFTPSYFAELGVCEFNSPVGPGTSDREELKKKPVGKTALENQLEPELGSLSCS